MPESQCQLRNSHLFLHLCNRSLAPAQPYFLAVVVVVVVVELLHSWVNMQCAAEEVALFEQEAPQPPRHPRGNPLLHVLDARTIRTSAGHAGNMPV